MNKYKLGDKIVLTVSDVNEKAYYSYYVFNNNDLILWEPSTDKYAEPLSTYTEPLEAKIRRQAAEITRLLADNKRLKAENGNVIWEIEQAFDRGCNEAWELARKIASTAGGLSSSELVEIFNAFLPRDILSENTYPEAAAKVSEWKKAKEEIKRGDIVKIREGNNNDLCVLCMSTDKKYYNAVDGYGAVYYLLTKEMIAKTGRHIDVDSFLKQIGGEEEC